MIEVTSLTKTYGKTAALTGLDINVKKGSVYGLVGVNGSGKTTVLKHIAGVLRADAGRVLIEGEEVYENIGLKSRMAFIPDDLYFFGSYTLKESARFYGKLYPGWDAGFYGEMRALFALDDGKKLSRFSKGMQKQAAFVLCMSAMPDYLILDEPIDGLDPMVRQLVRQRLVEGVAERGMTVLVSSHNLREMEGICDSIGILSKGRMLIERDLDELKTDIHKVQAAFGPDVPVEGRYDGLNVLRAERRGAVDLLIVRDSRETVERVVGARSPLVFDLLPLSLEEIFIFEMGGDGHETESVLF
ncbi:MAG: ABC transporter ATP-binding protein [Clostridiales Family XIII bacterium]|jgi:ABC-2 type transport system ATP-binding protein|nr:ABC transporter ATP-binding protein [Clostridiales Family XIII bacterium]